MKKKFGHAVEAGESEMRMPPWRRVALGMLPQLAGRMRDVETPYMLWFEILEVFEAAYEQEPWDEATIRAVYGFATWCVMQPGGKTADDDLGTCVCVCFYKAIPRHPEARKDMPRWFTLAELEVSRQVFSYHIGDASFRELRDYFKKRAKMFRPDLRKAQIAAAEKLAGG